MSEPRKYELLKEDSIEYKGRTLYRIKAVRDFGRVKAGDIGGYIEKEYNLDHDDKCWIYHNAKVFDDARVFQNAEIMSSAEVFEHAKVYGYAKVLMVMLKYMILLLFVMTLKSLMKLLYMELL